MGMDTVVLIFAVSTFGLARNENPRDIYDPRHRTLQKTISIFPVMSDANSLDTVCISIHIDTHISLAGPAQREMHFRGRKVE